MDDLREAICSALVEHMLALDLHGRAEVEEIADRILALVDAESGWVSVKERPPTKPGDYEVCWEHFVPHPVYEPMPMYWDGNRWERELHPTHWRQFTSPPKEEP